jgi:hypothetical protein
MIFKFASLFETVSPYEIHLTSVRDVVGLQVGYVFGFLCDSVSPRPAPPLSAYQQLVL